MSIPLDKLYHYLEGLSSDDVIIYRWTPHGSKKIEDLKVLKFHDDRFDNMTFENWMRFMSTPVMICSDQEVLEYDRYLPNQLENFYNCFFQTRFHYSQYYNSVHFKKMITNMNLRAAITMPLNIFDKVLLCHSEKNSMELKKYEDNGFIGVYYWSHAIIARDWFRYAEYDPELQQNADHFEKDFLIYNRAWSGTREYRLKFIELLINNNLEKYCNVSFNTVDDDYHYTHHKFKNELLSITSSNFEDLLPANTSVSSASAEYDSIDYNTSGLEIVLETLFDDHRQHLTEKSLRPIACGKPFILASTPGSLTYLKSYGFRTFSEFIDESYDNIKDPLQRLNAIVNEMKRISALPGDDKKLLWAQLSKIANYNKKLFFSKEWQDLIVNEYRSNLRNGLIQVNETCTGYYWKQLFSTELLDITNAMLSTSSRGFKLEDLISKIKCPQRTGGSIIPVQSSPGSDSE